MRWLAISTMGVLGVRAGVDALRLSAELEYVELFRQSFDPRHGRDAARALGASEAHLATLGHVADALLAAGALLFASWLMLRYRERGSRRPAHWALWSWLVPGLNLVEPYRLVRDVWSGNADEDGRAPWLVFGWWTAWLLYLLMIFGVMASEARAGELLAAGEPLRAFEESLRARHMGIALVASSLCAATLGALVVGAIERRVSAPG